MANELTLSERQRLALASNKNIGEVLKPFITEIHLFDTFVAGTSFVENESVFTRLQKEEQLKLIREDNKFDSNAIVIKNIEDEKIGYIPQKDNIVFARLLDAGKCLGAKVKNVEKNGSYYKISIGIYLIDL